MPHLGFVLDSTASISLVNKGQQELGRRQLLYLKLSIDWQINANSRFALCCFPPSSASPLLSSPFFSQCDYSFTCHCFNLLISLKDIRPLALKWSTGVCGCVCVLTNLQPPQSMWTDTVKRMELWQLSVPPWIVPPSVQGKKLHAWSNTV